MATDTTHDTDPPTASRRDAEPAAEDLEAALAAVDELLEATLTTLDMAIEEAGAAAEDGMIEIGVTLRRLQLLRHLSAWLPDSLASWLVERWPAGWLPALGGERRGPDERDRER